MRQQIETEQSRGGDRRRSEGQRFGAVLRRLRQSSGLSGRALARSAGLAEASVSHYETGKRLPMPTALKKLARVLGVPAEVLSWFAYVGDPHDDIAKSAFIAVEGLMRAQVQLYEQAPQLKSDDQ